MAKPTAGKRGCTGTTKKRKPCNAAPLKGTDPPVCLAHADEETRASAGFGGAQEGSGRPRVSRPTEIAQRIVERNQCVLLRPYFKALGKLLHDDGTTEDCELPVKWVWAGVEEPAVRMEDLGAQIQAAEKLWDRIYGRPRQAFEHSGPDGGPQEHDHVFRFDGPARAAIDSLLATRAPARED